MSPVVRAELVEFLVARTRSHRVSRWEEPRTAGLYFWATHPEHDQIVVTWDEEVGAYGADWTCGAVAADDVARLVRAGRC